MTSPELAELAPERAAAELARVHRDNPAWLDSFSEAMAKERSANEVRWVFDTWGINQSEAGRLFGVSRQAVSRWALEGVPSTQVVAMADLAAATEILEHYLKPERIPAVVRRPASALGNRSLVDLLGQGRTDEIARACREMFQFTDRHR